MGQSNVTLANALTNTRSLLDEPTAAMWSNSELTTWLNEACYDIARRAEILRQYKQTAVTAETQDYNSPNDTFRIYRVTFSPTGSNQEYPLRFRGLENMDQFWGIIPSLPSAFPYLYTLWYSPEGASASGGSPTQMIIRLYPVPAQNGELNIYYYRLPVAAAMNTDTLDTAPGWEDITYDYACYRALRKDADPRWKDWQAIYEDKLANIVAVTRSYTDQPDYITTGPVGTPAWLYGGRASW